MDPSIDRPIDLTLATFVAILNNVLATDNTTQVDGRCNPAGHLNYLDTRERENKIYRVFNCSSLRFEEILTDLVATYYIIQLSTLVMIASYAAGSNILGLPCAHGPLLNSHQHS